MHARTTAGVWVAISVALASFEASGCGSDGEDLFSGGGTAGAIGAGGTSAGSGGGTSGGAAGDASTSGGSGGTSGSGGAGATGGAGNAGGAAGAGGSGGTGGSGLGTYVSALTGDDANPGTRSEPLLTIRQGIDSARATGGTAAVYVAEGRYGEKIQLVEGVDVFGGHQCDTVSCTWVRDPAAYESAILNVDAEGVLADDGITRATELDGFRIQGHDGTPSGRGRAAITLRGGTPTVSSNRINGPTVSGNGFLAGRSIGVLILGPANDPEGALIVSNEIQGGQSSAEPAIGVLIESASPGTAPANVHIQKNVISGGQGRSANGIAAWNSGPGTLVANNEIDAGTAEAGQAWGIVVGSSMAIDANRINLSGRSAGCTNPGFGNYCGGIASLSGTVQITNNVVFGVESNLSAGVMLMEAEVPSGAVVLNSNFIAGAPASNSGSAPERSAAVVLRIGSCSTCGFSGSLGKIRNNVLVPGRGEARFGVYEDAPQNRTQHPAALENNDFWFASLQPGADALYRYFDGSSETLLTTVNAVNNLDAAVSVLSVSGNFNADPEVDQSFHLPSSSPCIDAGTATEAPATDMDGDARPRGDAVDVGPDEAE
jgi:hypothetical protein